LRTLLNVTSFGLASSLPVEFTKTASKPLYHADAGHIQKSLQPMEQHRIWAFHLVLDMHLLDSHTLKTY
jgi:hypothetical protein